MPQSSYVTYKRTGLYRVPLPTTLGEEAAGVIGVLRARVIGTVGSDEKRNITLENGYDIILSSKSEGWDKPSAS